MERPDSAADRGGDNLTGCKDFRSENGLRQGQNLALTGLFVPSSLEPELTRLVVLTPSGWLQGYLAHKKPSPPRNLR